MGLQEGIGAFWPRGHASRRTQQQQDIRLDPPGARSPLARIVLRPSSLSRMQPLRGGFFFLPHQT